MPPQQKPVALSAIQGVLAVLGAIALIAGLWSASVIVALNTLGVIGFATVFVAAGFANGSDKLSTVINACVATGITAVVVAGLYFAFARPLDDDEKKFNILTFFGIAAILAIAVLATMAWREVQKAGQAPEKKCPDCANMVLAEAKKCQHCNYRFAD